MMYNDKPTFARIGKIDDPNVKSRGGPWIFLLSRTFEEQQGCLFNFDPDSRFYNRRAAYQDCARAVINHESNWQFLKGHK